MGSLNDGSREDIQRMCVEAFENFPVWDALGIDLRREYNRFNELRGSRSLFPYSIQHNQNDSGLISPDQVLCAHLSALSCKFTFKSKSSTTKAKSGATEIDTPKTVIILKVLPDLQEQRLEHLTHTALHLFLGSKKRVSGIQTLKKRVSPTALEVAPAVWSSQYFQDVVLRAQLTTFVSSALGSLTSTESPILLQKIRALGRDPLQEIHRRTLLLVLRSARVPKIQVDGQRSGFQSHTLADTVVEDDGIHDPNESQEDIQEREPYGARQKDQTHDGTLSYIEDEMEIDHIDPELAHECGSTYENVGGMDEELAVEYGMPYPGSNSSTRGAAPDNFEEIRGFSNAQLCDGEHVEDRASVRMQNDNSGDTEDDLSVDAMDDEDAGDPVEDPIGLSHGNFEHELYYNRDDGPQVMSNTRFYGDDLDLERYHQTCLDAAPEEEHFLTYRKSMYEVEKTEQWEDEYGHGDDWPENNPKMGTDNFFSSCGARPSQFCHDENHMDIRYNTEKVDYAMSRPFGEVEDDLQYDKFIDVTDGFTTEDTASMMTGQFEYHETECALDELALSIEEAEVLDCHGGKGENELFSRGNLY
ncbi:hypothetical protein N0V82_000790 [Gnomoniopsis sp. IMI 355080]|nr:hypothetical protein N0V82_000790 [Gnomoniopsis sp. IMI 355080]